MSNAADSSSSSDALPVASPPLAAAQSSYIELDTERAQHVPHQEPIPEEKTSAAASHQDEDEDEDAEDSEPLSEVDEIDPIAQQERVNAFLQALQFPEGGIAAAGAASSADEALSEPELAAAANLDPTQAAIAEVQEFLNRQQAAQARQAAAQAAAAEPRSPTSAAAAERAAAQAARKAEFAAKVEARRQQQRRERGEEEDEDVEEVDTPAARAARAQAEDQEDEEEEEEEEEEPVDETFVGWLKTRATDLINGKRAHQIRSSSKWLVSNTFSLATKTVYVVGTLALVALPLIVAEIGEATSIERQKRFMKANIPEELKTEIWLGVKPPPLQGDGAADMTLVQ